MKKDEIISYFKIHLCAWRGSKYGRVEQLPMFQVFGDEVEVDITINNPSLQAKKD